MRIKQLIEKLEDLATYFTLGANNACDSVKAGRKIGSQVSISYHEGREVVYNIAFNKVDEIIKEAKR